MPGEKSWDNPIDEAQAVQVGEMIRRLRMLFGWSQDELAQQAGVSRVVVSRYEGARASQKLADIHKIFGVFGESLGSLDAIFYGNTPTNKVDADELTIEKALKEVEGAKQRLERATKILNRLIMAKRESRRTV